MKLITITHKKTGKVFIGTESSNNGLTLKQFFEKYATDRALCPELYDDIQNDGAKAFTTREELTEESGVQMAMLEKQWIDLYRNRTYNTEATLYKFYFKE